MDAERIAAINEQARVFYLVVYGLAMPIFMALAILAEESGSVATKEALMDRVWPDTHVTDDSLVQFFRIQLMALSLGEPLEMFDQLGGLTDQRHGEVFG